MADKKIVTLEQLARNNTKVKEKLDEKISKKGDQTLDGSLITTGNISIQGNLNVQGSTQTVNQETLTIKDNIIAVNGDATSLETVGMIGTIAITGEDSLYLKDGTYYIDKQALLAAIGGKELAQKYSTFALLYLSKFNTLSLHPRFDEAYNVHLTISGEETLHLFWRDNDTLNPMSSESLFTFDYDNNNGEVTLVGNSKSRALYFKDQAIKSLEHKELIKSFLLDSTGNFVTEENFAKKGQAYATPVYNHNQGDDVNKYKTLRIGAGSYQKDDNGNVVSFTFDMGEDQAIATRADDIEDGSLVAWDDTQKKLVKAGFDVVRKEDLLNLTYPIGSIYMSMSATDPSILFGGSWEPLQNRFLLGAGDKYAAGATEGEEEVTLESSHIPNHNHNINHGHPSFKTSAGGAHEHTFTTKYVVTTAGKELVLDDRDPPLDSDDFTIVSSGAHTHTINIPAYTGESGYSCGKLTAGDCYAHNNMPPYLAVYMWRRVS